MTLNRKEYNKEYYLKNKEHIKEDHLKNKEHRREYLLKNKERIDEVQRKWYLKNRERIKIYTKEWRLKNKEHRQKWQNNKVRTDPNFRLTRNLRSRVRRMLKGISKSTHTMELVGCTIKELWIHLESCPTWEPWMTRENYGAGGWDVDHIKACAKFDQTNPEQQRICFHWSNLQPMEHIANIKKGGR